MGALSGALARLQANRGLRELREIAKGITKQLPEGFQEVSSCHLCAAASQRISDSGIDISTHGYSLPTDHRLHVLLLPARRCRGRI